MSSRANPGDLLDLATAETGCQEVPACEALMRSHRVQDRVTV